MTDYDPADYATEADGYSIDLYCRPCRNTGNYNEQWVHYWNEDETADLAAQDTAAREHHQRYHAQAQCGAVATFDPGKPCILPTGHPYPKHRDADGRGFTLNHTGDPQCPSI